MNCHDCPNQTDGKCCHQLIRPQGSKTMNLLDDRANDEADRHSQMMQAQREKVTFSGGKTYEIAIKDDSNDK